MMNQDQSQEQPQNIAEIGEQGKQNPSKVRSLRKESVNDNVHSFCFCCRNPEVDWPSIIFSTGRWVNEPRPLEERTFSYGATIEDLQPFISYMNEQLRTNSKWKDVNLNRYMIILENLALFSGGWSREDIEYANHLMHIYYGHSN